MCSRTSKLMSIRKLYWGKHSLRSHGIFDVTPTRASRARARAHSHTRSKCCGEGQFSKVFVADYFGEVNIPTLCTRAHETA